MMLSPTLFDVLAAAAMVANGGAPATVAVRTADLDLTSRAGVRRLDLRILHAASALCEPLRRPEPRSIVRYRRCRAAARGSAVEARDRAIAASAVRLARQSR